MSFPLFLIVFFWVAGLTFWRGLSERDPHFDRRKYFHDESDNLVRPFAKKERHLHNKQIRILYIQYIYICFAYATAHNIYIYIHIVCIIYVYIYICILFYSDGIVPSFLSLSQSNRQRIINQS